MPDQLSVHRNPGRNKGAIPYVVTVQSNRFRGSALRVIVPLLAAESFRLPDSDVGPHFRIEGRDVVLDPLQITNVPHDVLGPMVASLADDGDRVMFALDMLLSRAWR
jgi:toxin CcdB